MDASSLQTMNSLTDLIQCRPAPPNRTRYAEQEDHFPEGAVMIAFAMHLFSTYPDLKLIKLHPDGEHAKRFDFITWLTTSGFRKESGGKKPYAGTYFQSTTGRTVEITPKSGEGDVEANAGSIKIIAECKGGIINTNHPGQKSRLRKGLCEAIGISLKVPRSQTTLQFAVVPDTADVRSLAKRLVLRAHDAGIRIALVDRTGRVSPQ